MKLTKGERRLEAKAEFRCVGSKKWAVAGPAWRGVGLKRVTCLQIQYSTVLHEKRVLSPHRGRIQCEGVCAFGSLLANSTAQTKRAKRAVSRSVSQCLAVSDTKTTNPKQRVLSSRHKMFRSGLYY